MLGYIIFNEKNSLNNLGLAMLGNNEHYYASEKIESEEVPLRKNGSLTIRTGTYEDIIINRAFRIIDNEVLREKVIKIKKWLNIINDKKLFFDYNLTKYYTVKSTDIIEIKDNKKNSFDIKIKFICEPFLKIVEPGFVQVENNSNIINSGDVECEPVLKLLLSSTPSDVVFTIAGKKFTVKNVKDNLLIDGTMFRTISNGVEVRTIGDYPKLRVGASKITWDGTHIQSVSIIKNELYWG